MYFTYTHRNKIHSEIKSSQDKLAHETQYTTFSSQGWFALKCVSQGKMHNYERKLMCTCVCIVNSEWKCDVFADDVEKLTVVHF